MTDGWIQSVIEVEETWNVLKFNVQNYTKGTSDRGFILGTIDEVMQTLDDNAIQLQGILSSRFIGPFLNAVQNWEKALSLITEVLEVRTVVLCRIEIYSFVIPRPPYGPG